MLAFLLEFLALRSEFTERAESLEYLQSVRYWPDSLRANREQGFEGGRNSLPHRGREAAKVAPLLDKGFKDGAVHGN